MKRPLQLFDVQKILPRNEQLRAAIAAEAGPGSRSATRRRAAGLRFVRRRRRRVPRPLGQAGRRPPGRKQGTAGRVKINSPGGSAWEGVTICNLLVQHDAEVTTEILGMAASAAAIVAMAGKPAKMAANGMLLLHRAWGVCVGNCHDAAEMGEFLGQVDEAIAATFAAKCGKDAEEMLALMDGNDRGALGTRLSATKALKLGLIDQIVSARQKG